MIVKEILEDYHVAYNMEYVVLRYFNVAGADPEGEIGECHVPETHLIPIVLDVAAGKRVSIAVFGTDYDTPDGSCIGDYIHVMDLAEAHLQALHYLECKKESICLNLCNGTGTFILEIVEAARKVTGKNIEIVLKGRRYGDPAKLIGDNSKAKKVLRWEPKYSDIDTIIGHAWNWHKCMKY